MTREQATFSAMLAAVALYSLFPLFNALSVGVVSPLVYVFKACVVAVVIDGLLIVFYRLKNGIRLRLSFENVRPLYLASAAFLATVAYFFLVHALSIGSNSGVTMLYELWPLIVFFFMPLVFRDRILQLTIQEGAAAIIAIIGLALIVFFGGTGEIKKLGDIFGSGEMLGLLSGCLMAIAVLLKSKSFVDADLGKLNFSDYATIDLVNRVMTGGFALLGVIIFTPSKFIEIAQWDSSIGFGIVEGLGGLMYWFAVARSRRSAIQLLLYLAPVLAFVWLYILGLAQLSGGILFGAILIFSSNVVAHFRGEQTVAFFMAITSAVAFGALSYLTEANGEREGFLLTTASVTLYAILIGFLLARLANRNFVQRQACKEVLDLLSDSHSESLKTSVIDYLHNSFRISASNSEREYKALLAHEELSKNMRRKLTSIALLRINPISAGEFLTTISVGLLVIVSGYANRPYGILGDFYAFVVAVVVVYLTTSIIEQKDIRLGEDQIMRYSVDIDDDKIDPAYNFIFAGISLVVGIVVLVSVALALKYELIQPTI